MKNLRKMLFTSIILLSMSSVAHALEYTDHPSGTTDKSPYSKPNPTPTTNPPKTPSTNSSEKGSANPPSEAQNSIQQNRTGQNLMQKNTSRNSYRNANAHHTVISKADSAIKTHNGTLVDDDIVQKVKWAIKNDTSLSSQGKSIQVSVKEGGVTLIGSVKDEAERQKIEASIKQIKDVKTVNSKLSLINE